MLKNHLAVYLLILINFICAVFHAIFQLDLSANRGIYREFILTENLVITFIFVYFALIMLFGKIADKQMMVKMNIFFWANFILFVLFVKPTVTTLSIVENALIFPQNYYLLFLGVISFILSLISHHKLSTLAKR